MKPGSCGPAALGIQLVIYDENGEEIPRGSGKAGYICVRNPWPGRMLDGVGSGPSGSSTPTTRKFNRDPNSKDWHDWPFLCGDGAVEAEDGYFRILGRIDDVINVAGHRLGTKELESAAITVDEVAEAAAVPVVDEVRGKIVEMYIALKPGVRAERGDREEGIRRRSTRRSARSRDRRTCGSCADMPKTRSGKIMRRVIAGISNFADVGDVIDARQPRDRRGHPPPRAEREARARRGRASSQRRRRRRSRRTGRRGARTLRQAYGAPPDAAARICERERVRR